ASIAHNVRGNGRAWKEIVSELFTFTGQRQSDTNRLMRRTTTVAIGVLLLAATAGLTSRGTLLALSQHELPGRAQRTLTLQERVSYQRAIEEVYWRHRIWPKENSN